MEIFTRLFGSMLLFIYHCFDRIVIHGYLSGLSRPDQIVYFFRHVKGVATITKQVLSQRTIDYKNWVEAYARNRKIPIEWAEKGVRKQDYVGPALRPMGRADQTGVYFILKSMEQGPTFRSTAPKYPTADPGYRIIGKQRSRFTHYYFYLRDGVLGPMVLRVGSFLPFQTTYYLNGHNFIEAELKRAGVGLRKKDNAFVAVSDGKALQAAADRLTSERLRERLEYWTLVLAPKFSSRERRAMNLRRFYAINQIEYCLNFIFRRHFPIRKLFERSCEMGLWQLTVDHISQIFGVRVTKTFRGKLQSTLQKMDHGHHVLRAYWKNAFVKQYEKFLRFLRAEVCSNNLSDFRLKKGLDHLQAVRQRFHAILDRFAGFQAQALNVHIDFPLFEQLARPLVCGATKIPGIKLQDTRLVRLMEVLLHAGASVGGWTAAHLHAVILQTYKVPAERYRINQLRYDLRKMKAHGLLEREGRRYAYRLTEKGSKVALMFTLFHKRVCGPLAHSLFKHRPDARHQAKSKLELAYHKADAAVQEIIQLVQAA